MTTPALEAPVIQSWKAKTLRVTAFFQLGWDVPAPTSRSFWNAARADNPEVSERGLSGSEDIGLWNNGKLTVKIAPVGGETFRLDFTWESAWYREEGVSTLNAFMILVRQLVKSLQFPAVCRLAFGATIGWLMPDRTQAYIKLASKLPRISFDESMRELIFRYNRQGPSQFSMKAQPAELSLNRIMTWSCQNVVQLNPMLVPSGNNESIETSAVCDLDLSTDGTYNGTWSADQSLAWIELLIDEALQIIEKGDHI